MTVIINILLSTHNSVYFIYIFIGTDEVGQLMVNTYVQEKQINNTSTQESPVFMPRREFHQTPVVADSFYLFGFYIIFFIFSQHKKCIDMAPFKVTDKEKTFYKAGSFFFLYPRRS